MQEETIHDHYQVRGTRVLRSHPIRAYAVERIYPQDAWVSGVYQTLGAARSEATRMLKSGTPRVRITELTGEGGAEMLLEKEKK